MKTIGLLGGMSWESSAHYYAILNRAVRDRLGPPHSGRSVMLSVDFGEIERLQHRGEWDLLGDMLAADAARIEAAGADCLLLCTNTMHLVADRIAAVISIPLLHIADATGAAVRAAGITRVGLLGTAFTMEQPFYRERLAERFGLEVLVPPADERELVHRVIYDELVAGRVLPASREAYRRVIAGLADRGAKGVILGCTEIMLLVSQDDSDIPVFDTTTLHALAAVDFALSAPAAAPQMSSTSLP
ncbi:aspartate/glutamate racemase family protein [Sphingomonas sp. DT-207]|uniref:aspartate/glutamate racemase family protein n=1 Tax=Sphingomonas sp. DT-207 TaxID=3396167 RepID=UPI003F1968AE